MQTLMNGLALGGIYGLLAVAFSVVYGVLRMVNFAFGEVFMFGAFGSFLFSQANAVIAGYPTPMPELPAWVAAVIGCVIGGALGVLIERFAYKPLRSAPILSMMVTAIAVSMLLRAVGQFLFGAAQTGVPPAMGGAIIAFGVTIQRLDIVILAIAITATIAFAFVVQRSSTGRAIRALAEDRDAARLMGIGVDRMIATTFLMGSLMAALAGTLFSQRYGYAAATMGFLPALKALVAAVLGGIGSIPGAFLGGLFIGVTEELAASYVPQGSAYRDVVAFTLLALILWLRPQGLLGRREVEKV